MLSRQQLMAIRDQYRRRHGGTANMPLTDSDYLPEELQFLRVIDAYKRTCHRPDPTWSEVIDVLRALGWTPPARP